MKLKVPGPVQDAPPVAEIHPTSARAVQLHELAVETEIDPEPPAAPMVTEVAERLKVQAGEGCTGPELQPVRMKTHTACSVYRRIGRSSSNGSVSVRLRSAVKRVTERL